MAPPTKCFYSPTSFLLFHVYNTGDLHILYVTHIHPTGLSFSCGFRESCQRKILVATELQHLVWSFHWAVKYESFVRRCFTSHCSRNEHTTEGQFLEKTFDSPEEILSVANFRIEGRSGQHKLRDGVILLLLLRQRLRAKAAFVFLEATELTERNHGNKCQGNLPCITERKP